jgi:formate hydrogenlyase subunit 3/multisubunit Na+/H+ antiporter MnhD subunit
MTLVLAAAALLMASGTAALLLGRRAALANGLGVFGVLMASVFGLFSAVLALVSANTGDNTFSLPWLTTLGGSFTVGLDRLSAFFLVPVFGLSVLAAVYGGEYLSAYADRKNLGWAWFCFNTLVASMVLVVTARNGLLFLLAWEVMALTSYFLVTFERERPEVCEAGWIYLVATHLGTVFLLVLFVLLRAPGESSLDFGRQTQGWQPVGIPSVLFLLALVGFGTKAGIVPLHVWLPEAHPAAPSHVSALMSAVMVKLGIYGLLRTMVLLGGPERWWGPVLMILGLLGGLVGIAQALYQRDLKRALGYSTVENVGLILLGLGLGLWGWSEGRPGLAALGFAGALLHLWNHALLKGLMFLAAGSILHGTGTRDLEKLGGLIKPMPLTGTLFILGSVALAALPPLNVFVGEWLLYLGLLRAGLAFPDSRGLGALLAVGLLATVGGLAAICFVRLLSISCLGTARSEAARHAHEPGWAMRGPMVMLAGLSVLSGVAPALVLRLFAGVLDQILGRDVLADLDATGVSVATLGWVNLGVWAVIGGAAALLVWRLRTHGAAAAGTWGCGYAAPTPRIQYTARSFAELMAEHLLPRPFRPRLTRALPEGLFPGKSTFAADCSDPVTQRGYVRLFEGIGRACMRLWWVQYGTINLYLFYLMVLIFLGLAWMTVRTWL